MIIKIPAAFLICVIIILSVSGCGSGESSQEALYSSLPDRESTFEIGSDEDRPNPVRLQLKNDTLYVAYTGIARIELFDLNLNSIGNIPLNDPEPVYPTDFIVADSELFVCDHSKGVIVVYDRNGGFLESYGTMPDMKTKMSPFSMAYHRGVLYVGDAALRKILAIMMQPSPGVSERGELILDIPNSNAHALGFPSALIITPDGRILIGDAGKGTVEAFTCDGRYVYPFDSLPSARKIAPQGFAIDNLIDPSVQDTTSFDPSGIRDIGRIHVVDANAGQIHMFNPTGKYIASYPEKDRLEKPSDIAIDTAAKRVYVAEPVTGRIVIYKYGE